MMKKHLLFTGALALSAISGFAQDPVNNIQLQHMKREFSRTPVNMPDINGYKTLKADLHLHSMFSDGSVWPSVRADEAWREGLDVIAMTEHIENNPSKKYVGGDKNASYEMVLQRAGELDILLVKAGEITRSMPPGHMNALFIDDVNILDQEKAIDAIEKAGANGAFMLWNHPGWKAQQPDTCLWHSYHEDLYQRKLMHGIEVFNECEWYPLALDWCIEKGLAPIANSDVHGVAEYYYDYNKYPRPMTLIFAKERSLDSVKDALMNARTVAYFAGMLAGHEQYVKPLFDNSVKIEKGQFERNGESRYYITNTSDVTFVLSGDLNIELPAGKSVAVMRKSGKADIEVKNLYIGGTRNLKTSLQF